MSRQPSSGQGSFQKFNANMQAMPTRGNARMSTPIPYGANASTSVFSASGRQTPAPTHQSRHVSRENSSSSDEPKASEQSACSHCYSLKVKCEYGPGDRTCKRCRAGGHTCTPRQKRTRTVNMSQEELQQRSLQQDAQIEALLQQYDRMTLKGKVDTRMAQSTNSSNMASSSRYPVAQGARQAALARYPIPPAAPSALAPPDILERGIISVDEVETLFATFFDVVNPHFSVLDPQLHTPGSLIWNSQFLFTVVCAVASRYASCGSGAYPLLMEFAKDAAANALATGSKRVEVCQGYLLLGVYPVPQKRWRDDRSWMYMGLAIRMAIELGLHQPPSSSLSEREKLNRTRTWLVAFSVDGAHASLVGKTPMVSTDYLARTSVDWYRGSKMNIMCDVHLCAHVDLLVVFSDFRAKAVGLEEAVKAAGGRGLSSQLKELVVTVRKYDEKLSQITEKWMRNFQANSQVNAPMYGYRSSTFQLIATYSRLVVLSSAFQHVAKSGPAQEDYVVRKAISMASRSISIAVDGLAPTGRMRYALEEHFIYVAFAASFLLNLLRPHCVHLIPADIYNEITALVRRLIRTLQSDSVALDGRHTGALYARFLSAYVAKHHLSATIEIPPNPAPPAAPQFSIVDQSQYYATPGYGAPQQQTYMPQQMVWPELGGFTPGQYYAGGVAQQGNTFALPDMDFTIPFFMQAVTGETGWAQQPTFNFGAQY